jgi:hypothetical protein
MAPQHFDMGEDTVNEGLPSKLEVDDDRDNSTIFG